MSDRPAPCKCPHCGSQEGYFTFALIRVQYEGRFGRPRSEESSLGDSMIRENKTGTCNACLRRFLLRDSAPTY